MSHSPHRVSTDFSRTRFADFCDGVLHGH
jgi:hypothetical protein